MTSMAMLYFSSPMFVSPVFCADLEKSERAGSQITIPFDVKEGTANVRILSELEGENCDDWEKWKDAVTERINQLYQRFGNSFTCNEPHFSQVVFVIWSEINSKKISSSESGAQLGTPVSK